MTNIVIIPTQGFCNRLRAIASAYILSKYLQSNLFVIWNPEDCCNCHLTDIITNSFNTISLQTIHQSNNYLYAPDVHTNQLMNLLQQKTFDYLVIQGGHEFKHPNMSVLSFIQQKSLFYKSLQFTTTIQHIVNSVDSSNCVGIHYRDFIPKYDALDGRDFSKTSPLNQFVDIIKQMYLENKDRKFFLSSNTINAYAQLSLFIPNENIIMLKDIDTERNSSKGVIDAVANLLLLSKCKYIIGTLMSSYSDEACFFNLISKLCIGDEDIQSYHCYGFTKIFDHKMLLPNTNILCDIYKDKQ